ncbi:hypothetical protein TorRG33x02_048890, partial [Trema orientale]
MDAVKSDLGTILGKMSIMDRMEQLLLSWEPRHGAESSRMAATPSLASAVTPPQTTVADGSPHSEEPSADLNRLDRRPRRLEMPLFNGENPLGWVFRAERYFAVNAMTDAEKLEAA